MICQDLKDFVDAALDAGRLTMHDVDRLRSALLPDGVQRRSDADALAALDRLVGDKHPSWDDAFVDLVAGFVTAGSRETGHVGRDTVNWLMTTLDAAGAMTDNGLRIAIEVTRAAAQVDQALMTLVLQTMQSRRPVIRSGDSVGQINAGQSADVYGGSEDVTPRHDSANNQAKIAPGIAGARRAA